MPKDEKSPSDSPGKDIPDTDPQSFSKLHHQD